MKKINSLICTLVLTAAVFTFASCQSVKDIPEDLTKNYEKAQAGLEEILEIYSYAPVGSLPAAYKKLAQLDMEKIPNRSAEE